MSQPSTIEKLAILADAAKYDASCASSGTSKRNSKGSAKGTGAIGSTEGMGICHSYAPDGRCISLLKILLTNHCIFDCHYCINRKSSNTPRARFSPQEVAELTMAFYRRNYIEGLFLSSGIVKNADHTMEQMVEAARILREEHQFRGYIHLKHFKFVMPKGPWGKRRLHQSPTAKEIDTCRWWLEGERALVQPKLVLALGASAARSLLGRTASIARERGRPHPRADGSELWITAHPSYLLRLEGAAQEEQERLFAADLAAVAERLAELVE